MCKLCVGGGVEGGCFAVLLERCLVEHVSNKTCLSHSAVVLRLGARRVYFIKQSVLLALHVFLMRCLWVPVLQLSSATSLPLHMLHNSTCLYMQCMQLQ